MQLHRSTPEDELHLPDDGQTTLAQSSKLSTLQGRGVSPFADALAPAPGHALAADPSLSGGLGNNTDLLSAPLSGLGSSQLGAAPRRRSPRFAERRAIRGRRLGVARKVCRDSKIANCLWGIAHKREDDSLPVKDQLAAGVQVVQSANGTCGYAGVIRCGLRACPWCTWVRANEDFHRARRVARTWVDSGSMLLMVAFTMSHKIDEPLLVTKDAFILAQQDLHSGRPWRRFSEHYGVGERFYGNEITDGQNGWHFHRHTVYQITMSGRVRDRKSRRRFAKRIERELTVMWLKVLRKRGRTALPKYAVKVSVSAGLEESPEEAADYVTKFALEATSSMTKDGRQGGRSPWQLLDDASDKKLSAAQRARARERFREFAASTRGMHWTFFSEGCRDIAGPSEEEREWADDPGVPVLQVTDQQWRCIRFLGKQVWLLELVEREGSGVAAVELQRLCDPLYWTKRFRWRPDWWRETAGGELMDEAVF